MKFNHIIQNKGDDNIVKFRNPDIKEGDIM